MFFSGRYINYIYFFLTSPELDHSMTISHPVESWARARVHKNINYPRRTGEKWLPRPARRTPQSIRLVAEALWIPVGWLTNVIATTVMRVCKSNYSRLFIKLWRSIYFGRDFFEVETNTLAVDPFADVRHQPLVKMFDVKTFYFFCVEENKNLKYTQWWSYSSFERREASFKSMEFTVFLLLLSLLEITKNMRFRRFFFENIALYFFLSITFEYTPDQILHFFNSLSTGI